MKVFKKVGLFFISGLCLLPFICVVFIFEQIIPVLVIINKFFDEKGCLIFDYFEAKINERN